MSLAVQEQRFPNVAKYRYNDMLQLQTGSSMGDCCVKNTKYGILKPLPLFHKICLMNAGKETYGYDPEQKMAHWGPEIQRKELATNWK